MDSYWLLGGYKMKFVHYDKDGKILGFYSEDVHGERFIEDENGNRVKNPSCKIPEDVVEISDDEWKKCLTNVNDWKVDVQNKKLVYSPYTPSLEELKAELRIKVHRERKRREAEGIIVKFSSGEEVNVDTSLTGRANLMGVMQAFASGVLTGTVKWKFRDNKFIDLTKNQLQEIGNFILHYIETLFNAEAAFNQQIDALSSVIDAEAFDVSKGWPSSVYESKAL